MGKRSSRGRPRDGDSNDIEDESRATSPGTGRRSTGSVRGDRIAGTRATVGTEPSVQRSPTEGRASAGRDAGGSGTGHVGYDPGPDRQALGARYGIEIRRGEARTLQRLEADFGTDRVSRWAEEGMTVETMGKPRDMEAFRERQAERLGEVPTDVERRNEASLQRNAAGNRDDGPAGETGVPEVVRDVVSSPGRSLDGTVKREMEAKVGGDFADVRVHTGPQAAAAAESINARAFTVGNHVAFNGGEYQPESSEGQRVLAHELTHVRQQTEGAVSMLPKADADLVVDPDPELEREAEERARRAVDDVEPGTVTPTGGEVHVQPKLKASSQPTPGSSGSDEQGARASLDSEEHEEGALIVDSEGSDQDVGGTLPGSVQRQSGAGGASGASGGSNTPTVNVTTNIRSPTTPSGMPDRIPPRVDFDVDVAVGGWNPPMNPVTLSIDGAGGGNGSATIDGAATADVTGNETVTLRGTNQTSPGNAGNLSLVAELGSDTLARSNAFSVAAIPQNFSIAFDSLVTGARRGIRVENHWESDSGNLADLDQVERSEQVQYGSGSGIFAGVTGQNSGYLPADSAPTTDRHSVSAAAVTGPGHIVADQVFIFEDARTGVSDVPVANSGFQITRTALQLLGITTLTTSKVGTATTANGYSSAAGSGAVSRTQTI